MQIHAWSYVADEGNSGRVLLNVSFVRPGADSFIFWSSLGLHVDPHRSWSWIGGLRPERHRMLRARKEELMS